MAEPLKGRRIAILATDGFEQVELISPREALEKAGARCVVISPREGEIQGFKHHDKADTVRVDLSLAKADPNDFDAVLLPGGVINSDALRVEKKAQQCVQEIDRSGKPVMVICHGGWLLVSAGLVRGRTLTSWPTLQDDMRNAGAEWKDEQCVRDRNWVSSRKPDDLPAFNVEIVKVMTEMQSVKAAKPGSRDSQEVRS